VPLILASDIPHHVAHAPAARVFSGIGTSHSGMPGGLRSGRCAGNDHRIRVDIERRIVQARLQVL